MRRILYTDVLVALRSGIVTVGIRQILPFGNLISSTMQQSHKASRRTVIVKKSHLREEQQ